MVLQETVYAIKLTCLLLAHDPEDAALLEGHDRLERLRRLKLRTHLRRNVRERVQRADNYPPFSSILHIAAHIQHDP